MAVSLHAETPLAAQLTSIVQTRLVDIGWSTGGPDDSALAEYIVLMLINGKTQEQMASELSNELLSLGPEDTAATDFAKWLFEQVETLTKQPGESAPPAMQASQPMPTHAIPSFTGGETHQEQKRQQGEAGSHDADMGDAMDVVQNGVIPTGPKSMRNNPRGNKRIVGQINKAMDRSSDAVLHRVKTPGSERINMHNRQPPKGPRANGPPNRFNHGVTTGPLKGGPMGGPMGGRGQPGGFVQNQPQISPQQQMQLLAFYEQQTKMIQSIFSPGQQQALMPGIPAPAINPAFRQGGPHNQSHGKSLFDRVQPKPNGNFSQGRGRNNGHPSQSHPKPQDSEMADDTSMEVESSQQASDLSPDTICKFNLKCTKADCIFAHQSPAAPPGTTIDVSDHCPYGAACQNRKCVARHPSPAQKKSHQADQDCKFYPNCTNTHCPFRHPTMPVCRNGADCTREGCKFTHVKTMCRFNPCLNPTCVYKHEEGQKRGKFGDMVWKADAGSANGGETEHVSERKFVVDDEEQEELIVPGATGQAQESRSAGADAGAGPNLSTEIAT